MPHRVFLDWSRPFLSGITEWLMEGWKMERGALDLSGTVVIVPTAEAGRRLREALAVKAAERNSGVLSPEVITPEVVITWGLPARARVAGPGEMVMAWASVLEGLRLADWRDIFPLDPVRQDAGWAVQTAGDLLRVRRNLEEGARTVAMAAKDLESANPEAARWRALARLEELAGRRLEDAGWMDSVSARLAAARAPVLPGGQRRVIVAGVPDSIELVRVALENLENQGIGVEVAVHAPQALAYGFDDWGRPLPKVWMHRQIEIPDADRAISLVPRPGDEADSILAEIAKAGGAAETEIWRRDVGPLPLRTMLAFGSADPAVSAPLRQKAAQAGVAIFDPEGSPLMEHEVSWLLRQLTLLVRADSWTAAGLLLRVPDVRQVFSEGLEGARDLGVLSDWDDFQQERLPQSLTHAAPLAAEWAEIDWERRRNRSCGDQPGTRSRLPDVIAWFRQKARALEDQPLPAAMDELLENVYRRRTFPDGLDRQIFLKAVTAWQDAILSVQQGAEIFMPEMGAAARLELAEVLLRDARLYTSNRTDGLALHGWLELPWQDAPDLVIAGMNEGMAPDTVTGDPWLPDSIRGALDLKTNDTRLARDSYLLTAMIQSRLETGSIRLVAARESAEGDPLKPSRLLLRCATETLPHRALRLFPKEQEEHGKTLTSPSWHRAWKLKVPPPRENARVFRQLSVTAFKDYLACPFRFYLKQVLEMTLEEAAPSELDARKFGNLLHESMQALHQNPDLRDSTNAGALTAFLKDDAHRRIHHIHGPRLTIPLAMQLESLQNRLAAAARLHAEEREKGWRFKAVEIDFPKLPGSDTPVNISGVEIRGRIDLIEQHPALGLRILDYKTAARSEQPRAAHIKPTRGIEDAPEWKYFETGGKRHQWTNLQLPLYSEIMTNHYSGTERQGRPVAAGYVNLPPAVSASAVIVWEDLDEVLLTSARRCATEVIGAIRQGIFLPAAGRVTYDDYKPLIFDSVEASFDTNRLEKFAELVADGHLRPGSGG